tara:strand:+ start:623 stop:808 length:186 start_codon:yes stop_codon:yes gene_type:complete
MKRKLHGLFPKLDYIEESAEEWAAFGAGLKEAWAAIPNSLIKKLVTSIPRRVEACRCARGY